TLESHFVHIIGLEHKKALVVEDDESNAILIEKYLRKLKFSVGIVKNGIDAVDKFKSVDYDIIIMDLGLPLMNGIEATKAIRELETETGSHIPIIALTAHAYELDKSNCLKAGMDDYLAKPLDVKLLNEKIMKLAENPAQ
ncbi:MAG: hypothetical protein QG635_1350, partial [Bacteroidota bacterium]|nr:hypothetical protein [Bacteroidota bacterium]